MSDYEAVIGLEVHVHLATESKLFCSCPNSFGDAPNTNVCEICAGMPGVLPSLNRKAVEYAARMALAKPDCMIQHPLPAHRGEEITAEVLEAHANEIFDEAEHRIYVEKAVLAILLAGK